ncbi:MAG: protein kinase [Thermoanaerobaculia bacterium]|nr:protein kinase [Thermoanaerobaculia bacterium]
MKETNVMIGGKLGRYEILDVLGRGGQSIAYKARDPKIDRIVAVKQILSKTSLSEKDRAEFFARFMRESQAAGRLSHPNIATIYDVGGDEEGEPYIAMEYVDGCDLDELIRSDHPLSQERVLRLFVQLCGALDYAHDAGIVHRDIKPGNIMITRGDRVKVVDFGIAKMDSSSLTQAGMVMGTPSYMSPEQIMGKTLDRRSDIFSLGVVLYEALTGEKPFLGEHWTTVTFRIVNEPHGSVLNRKREPTLLPGFDPILDKALEKAPANRYQTCAELVGDLELLLRESRLDSSLGIGHATTQAALHAEDDPSEQVSPVSIGLTSGPAPDSSRRRQQNDRTAITGGPGPTREVAVAIAPSSRGGEVPEEWERRADRAVHAESTASPISPVATPPAGWTFTISRVGSAANERAPDFPSSPSSDSPIPSSASESDSRKPRESPSSQSLSNPKAGIALAPGTPARDDALATSGTGAAMVAPGEMVGLPHEFSDRTGPARRRGWTALLAAAAAIVVVATFVVLSRVSGDAAAKPPVAAATVEPVPGAPASAAVEPPSAVTEPLRAARAALGEGLIIGRDGKDALHFVTEALALDPDNTDAKKLEADIRARALQHVDDLRKQGKADEVQEAWGMLLEDFPGDAEIQAKHDAAQATRSRALLAAELERSRSAGEKAFAAGDYAEASTQFGKLTRHDPRNASAFYFLGRSNVGRGALADAERNLTRACELEPRNPTYAIQLSRVLETNKKLPGSLAYLEKGIQLGGDRENSAASLGAHVSLLRLRLELRALTPHTFRSRHVHRFAGRCDGQLIVTEAGVSFLPDEQKDHAIQAGWGDIKRFAIRSGRVEIELTESRKQTYECSELDRAARIAEVVSRRH